MGTGLQGQASQGAGGSIQLIIIDWLPGGAGDPNSAILTPVADGLLPFTKLVSGSAPIAEGVALVLQGPGRADPVVGWHGADAVGSHSRWVVLIILRVLGGVGAVILRDPAGHRVEP